VARDVPTDVSVRIEQCIGISATPAAVWDAIDDIPSHGEWMRDAAEIKVLTQQRGGVGAEFGCLTKIGPLREHDVLRVTEWEPGVAMGIEHLGVVSGNARFTLTPSEHGTRFCWVEVLRFPWWMGGVVGERFAKPVLAHVWRGNLQRLKGLVEGDRASG
jgi:hypothetical protein